MKSVIKVGQIGRMSTTLPNFVLCCRYAESFCESVKVFITKYVLPVLLFLILYKLTLALNLWSEILNRTW